MQRKRGAASVRDEEEGAEVGPEEGTVAEAAPQVRIAL